MALQSLQSLLKGVQSDPVWHDYRTLERIQSLWTEVVGGAVALHTRPLRIQRQVLHIATSTSAWAQNLVFQRHLILQKLNPHLPHPLKDLRFLPGEWHQTLEEYPLADSWVAASRPSKVARPPRNLPQTPQEAFDRWALLVKQSHLQSFPCPNCRCPTPPAELDRWYVCGYCHAKGMR